MRHTRPLAALAAAAALIVPVGLASVPAQAASTYDPVPAKSGATWLSGQVTDGLVHNEQYDFDDIGLSIDVALGLDGAGQKPTVVKAITKAVAKNVSFYTSFAPSIYAGAAAKAAVLALSQDKDPHAFGGVDLVEQLEGRVATAAPITGRIEDAFDPDDEFGGDYANVIGQTYAAQALSLVGSAKASSATKFLLQQQCDKGYFRQYFTADKTRVDQSCQGAPRAERGASTDATALAVLALQDVKGSQAKAAVKKAVAWLEDTQLGNGAFTDSGKASGAANTNSTGLAGWALGVFGDAGAASAAAVAVRTFQVSSTNPCSAKLAGDAGAIAYDLTSYEAGLVKGVKGVKNKTSDQWRRASAQALPVLQWAPKGAGAVTASGPSGTVGGGDSFAIAFTGVAPGQRVCVARGGEAFEFVPGRKAISKVTLQAPHGTATRTYSVYVGATKLDVAVRVAG